MTDRAKPFLSENNPLNMQVNEGEKFSYRYFFPQYWLGWIIILLSLILTYLPKIFRDTIGAFLGFLIYTTNKKRKNIAEKNLSLCFKDKSKIEIKQIVKEYFKNLGKSYLNIPVLWWKSDIKLQKICSLDNIHYIQNELQNGRSVILFTAHTVTLDFGGRSISSFPIISIYKPFRNELLNWFIGRSRSKSTDNVVVFPREKFIFKNIIKALKKPLVFYYLADEDLGKKDSVFVPFFDELKATLSSIGKLSSLTNAAVIPCINLYDSNSNSYKTYVDKPLENFPSGDNEKDARSINARLENLISKDLSQYMWSLRLFQTRPQGGEYPYK